MNINGRTAITALTFLSTMVTLQSSYAGVIVPVSSNFDSGPGGWVLPTGTIWTSSGGNPGGMILGNADGTSPPGNPDAAATAPSKFLGDWTSLKGSGHLFYDFKLIDTGIVSITHLPLAVEVGGPGGTMIWTGQTLDPVPTPWFTVDVPITQSSWSISSGNFDSILADVTSVTIRMELFGNLNNTEDVAAIDNVVLVAVVPEPSSIAILGLGILALARRRRV